MSGPAGLAALEQVIGSSGVAARIEVLLPAGVPAQAAQRPGAAGRDVPDPGRRAARASHPVSARPWSACPARTSGGPAS